MARFYKLILLFCFLMLFPSCQNEGDIGDLYGQWSLKNACIDNVTKEYCNLFLSFQGKVVWAKRVNYGSHTYGDVVGSFEHRGDSLIMSFIQQNEYTSPESLIEEEFGFSDCENVRLLVKTLDSNSLVLMNDNDYWSFVKF